MNTVTDPTTGDPPVDVVTPVRRIVRPTDWNSMNCSQSTFPLDVKSRNIVPDKLGVIPPMFIDDIVPLVKWMYIEHLYSVPTMYPQGQIKL